MLSGMWIVELHISHAYGVVSLSPKRIEMAHAAQVRPPNIFDIRHVETQNVLLGCPLHTRGHDARFGELTEHHQKPSRAKKLADAAIDHDVTMQPSDAVSLTEGCLRTQTTRNRARETAELQRSELRRRHEVEVCNFVVSLYHLQNTSSGD